jgi:hypothetical protein
MLLAGLEQKVVSSKCAAAAKESQRAEGSIATRNRMFI